MLRESSGFLTCPSEEAEIVKWSLYLVKVNILIRILRKNFLKIYLMKETALNEKYYSGLKVVTWLAEGLG